MRAGAAGGSPGGWIRAGAAAGVVGPVAFTAAWVVGSLRQTGHPATAIQISGLAAPDARDPWIMITGFLVLGGCAVAFGAALHRALGGRSRAGPAPRLIQGTGLLTIAAGLLRRDHMQLTSGGVSWHNHAHDVISAVIYVALVAVQLLLAVRFGGDPRWRRWRPYLLASGIASAAALSVFAADTSAQDAGVIQRIAVTIPLAAIVAIALFMTLSLAGCRRGNEVWGAQAPMGQRFKARLVSGVAASRCPSCRPPPGSSHGPHPEQAGSAGYTTRDSPE